MGYELKNGKAVEASIIDAMIRAGGVDVGDPGRHNGEMGLAFGEMGWEIVNETAKAAKYEVYSPDGRRVNIGRGQLIWDAILPGGGVIWQRLVSLKCGDSRDLSTKTSLVKALVEAGFPIWAWCCEGSSPDRRALLQPGVRFDLARVENIRVRRINVTPVLVDFLETWDMVPSAGQVAHVRAMKVGKYKYPRVRVNWKKVPPSYWLDGGYRPLTDLL